MKKFILKLKLWFIPCESNHYKPRILASDFLFYYVLALLFLKLITVGFLVYFPKTVFFADLTKTALVQLTNQEREGLGLSVLKENPKLNQAAQEKAQDILNNDYFSHQSPAGVSPWYWFKKAGYNYKVAGENLAVGFLDSEEVVNAWNNSPTHKANLVNPKFQETGMAVLKGDFQGSETTIVVQLFGTSQSEEKKTVTTATKPKIEAETKEKTVSEQKPTEIVSTPIEEKVLPETTEEPIIETKEEIAGEETLEESGIVNGTTDENKVQIAATLPETQKIKSSSNFFEFMVLEYPGIIQKIIFYSLLFITLSLMLNIFIRIDIQDKKLILKTTAFVILLILFILSDKEIITQLIPHNLLI